MNSRVRGHGSLWNSAASDWPSSSKAGTSSRSLTFEGPRAAGVPAGLFPPRTPAQEPADCRGLAIRE